MFNPNYNTVNKFIALFRSSYVAKTLKTKHANQLHSIW